MRLPFKGLFVLTQEFGNDLVINGVHVYSQYLVLYPDGQKHPMIGHNGLDFGLPHRTEVIAPHSGKIIEAQSDPSGYGNYIKIENDQEGSVLAHLDSIDVNVGYQLNEGDHLGWSDSTGNSTAPHLHWGYYRMPRDRANGMAGFVDQRPFLLLLTSGIKLVLGQLPEINGVTTEITNNSVPIGEVDYHGLDPNNKDSIQVAINTWADVALNNKYKTAEEYRALEQQLDEVKRQLIGVQEADKTVSSDLKSYNEMKALGYNTVDDISKALAHKDDTNLKLQQEVVQVKQRNIVLSDEIRKMEEEDHTTAQLGQSFVDENKDLRDALAQIAKATGADKVNTQHIVSKIFNFKDLADRFIKSVEKTTQSKVIENKPDRVVVTVPKKYDSKWLVDLFSGKVVK